MIADALRTTHETARYILDHGLHCLLTVEGNQPTIQAQLHDDYHGTAVAYAERGLGHGRIERRTIQVSPELVREGPWLAFPRVRFAARLVREVIYKTTGAVSATEVVYPLTSLPPELATPEHLLRWLRLYWMIENRVHDVPDTALKEDAYRARKGFLPWAMSNLKLRPHAAVGGVWSAAACGGAA